MVLGTAQGLHTLAVGGTGGIDVARDGCGTDKAHGLDVGVGEDRVHHLFIAVDHVEYPGRQTGFLEEFGEQQRGRWVALRRLENEGVAAGQGHRKHPQRHHGWEVERSDAGDHAQRLAQRMRVDGAADVLAHFAFEQVRAAAGEFDHFQAAYHLA
ncbi:hypothetical protein D9M71_435280 [compost metagenome]